MRIDEFRALEAEEKVRLVNERLQELKEAGKGTKEFRSDKLEFSYATAIKEMENLGYARNGNVFEKEVKLSEYEIRQLKNLAYSYEFLMRRIEDQPKVRRRNDDQAVTTSVRMYNKVWKRWQEFSKEWSIFNNIDLMASALEEYMDRHAFEDYDTLALQGKIKEDDKK